MWPVFYALRDGLFPPRCVTRGCGRRGAWLCAPCAAAIVPVAAPACARCGAALAPGRPCLDCALIGPRFARAVAVGAYVSPLREAVHTLKYRAAPALAEPLGALLAARLVGEAVDLVLPVPSHGRRLRRRGWDHARLLAEAVARELGRPVDPGLLYRVRATRPQVGLEPAARQANVAGAFAARGPVAADRVALVDDVLTTGATASACAAVLLAAGAREVVVATVARASAREPALGRARARHV